MQSRLSSGLFAVIGTGLQNTTDTVHRLDQEAKAAADYACVHRRASPELNAAAAATRARREDTLTKQTQRARKRRISRGGGGARARAGVRRDHLPGEPGGSPTA